MDISRDHWRLKTHGGLTARSPTAVIAFILIFDGLVDGPATSNASLYTNEMQSRTRLPQTPRKSTPNEDLASKLGASFARTPFQEMPNSARKRRYIPTTLTRQVASPSHSAKMSTLFEDAASTLHRAMSPSPRQVPSNIRKLRTRYPQARDTRFGHLQDENVSIDQPVSSDRTSGAGTKAFGQFSIDPRTPPRPRLTAGDLILYESLTDHPTPSQNMVGSVAAVAASNGLVRDIKAKEPISSGFATPINASTPYPQSPAEIEYPDFSSCQLPPSSPPVNVRDSDDDEVHSTHGVRLIMPYTHIDAEQAQQANIDAWLEEVLGAGSGSVPPREPFGQDGAEVLATSDDSETPLCPDDPVLDTWKGSTSHPTAESPRIDRPPSRQSSNKENDRPPEVSPPRLQSPLDKPSIRPPWRFRSSVYPSVPPADLPKSPIIFTHPLTPARWLSAPPKRKKLRVNSDPDTPSKVSQSTAQDFTIHDDDLAAALAKLSPSVDRHRKGRGPKRERCSSYWDNDVLDPDSPAYRPPKQEPEAVEAGGKMLRNGKQVLGESKQSAKLTRAEPFTTDAAAAAFDFEAS